MAGQNWQLIAWLRFWILKLTYPVIKFVGNVGKKEPKVGADYFHLVAETALPGDVLLSRKEWQFTNLIIPGFWPHIAMYVGLKMHNGKMVPMVIEAVGNGVHLVPLAEWILKKDAVAHLRPLFCDASTASMACIHACGLDGDEYDYEFSSGNQSWYCAEVPWWSYDQVLKPSPFEFRETWGVKTATPQDYWDAVKKWALLSQCGTKMQRGV